MKSVVSSVFNFLGGVSGLLSICVVFWRGGAIEKQVDVTAKDVTEIRQTGSAGLREHVKMDDERVMDLARRMGQLEDYVKQAVDLKIEVRVLGSKLDNIATRLERMEQNAAVIKLHDPKP